MKPVGPNDGMKKAQTTRLASFGPLVSSFIYLFVFYVTN